MKEFIIWLVVIPFILLLVNVLATGAGIVSIIFLFLLGGLSIFVFWYFYAPYQRLIIEGSYIENPIFRRVEFSLNDVSGIDLFEEYERGYRSEVLVRKSQVFFKNTSIQLDGREAFDMIFMHLSEFKTVKEKESSLILKGHLLDSDENFYETRTLRSIEFETDHE